MTSLSVKDIAEKVQRIDESLQAAVDRLRNWTKEGLLSTAGEKHPGTGRPRKYSRDALLEAALLEILTGNIGMSAARAAPSLKAIKKLLEPKWQASGPYQPGQPRRMYHTREGLPGRNTLGRDVLVLSKAVGKKGLVIAVIQLQHLQEHLQPERYDAHIIIDLQLMFDRLLMPLEEV
jgi:uncharacterized protein YciI